MAVDISAETMSDYSLMMRLVQQGMKRDQRSDDDEDSVVCLLDEEDSNESKRFKREDEYKEPAKIAVIDLSDGESCDEDQKNNNQPLVVKIQSEKCNDDVLPNVREALQKARDVFRIDLNFGEFDGSAKNTERTKDESVFYVKDNDTECLDKILATDIPERMQLRSPPVTSAPEEDLIVEAHWIYVHAFERKTISVQDSHLKPEAKEHAKKAPHVASKIAIVLDLLKNQHLEVPFIAFYRKELVLPELNLKDLWRIYEFDARWCELRLRREILRELFQAARVEEDGFEKAETIEAMNDWFRYFVLHYGGGFCGGAYCGYREAGLDGLVRKFGLSSRQFAENVRQDAKVHKVEREAVVPRILATGYTSEKFPTVEEVLKIARLAMATQIACEPDVKESVRRLYVENAKVSVRPTKKGLQLVDEKHPVYAMKYLKDKPVKELVGEEYLRLAMAQDGGLIEMSFSDGIEGDYVERMKLLFCSDEKSRHTRQWNFLRGDIVDLALSRIVIPELKKELHSLLLAEAKDCVIRACARRIYNWLKVAPYRPTAKDHDGLRVMGVAYPTDPSSAAFACVISPDGECTDYLNLPNLLALKNSSLESDRTTMTIALTAVKNLIGMRKPHAIAIAGESADATAIAEEFRKMTSAAVEIVENGPAIVYSNSRRGVDEFPSYPPTLRQAISLARRLRDPLLEFSQLCNADEEVLDLKLHGLQEQVPRKELLGKVYSEFVNRANEVGVDVDMAVRMPYFGSLLQFVGGFGPRKARYFIETLQNENQRVESRQQLTTLCHLGPTIFANCAGFLKIPTSVNVLDGTRVHPQLYDWAEQIAANALDYETEEESSADALKDIRECPERLKELDLDAFAEALERQGFGNKCATIYDIRSELTSGYKDLRLPYQSPTPDKLFEIFAKESPTDFYVGKLVDATVEGVSKNLTWIRLDNGIFGYIHAKNLSERHAEGRIGMGSRVRCRVVQIETEKFCVEASSKDSDLYDREYEWRLPRDPYYDIEAEAEDSPPIEEPKMKPIVHRCFRNVTWIDAERLLHNMRQGETIIRPSSKGDEYLCFTWKVTDGVYQHIAVRDDGVKNKLMLGGSLWIGNQEYQDFDDIIARYIEPIAAHVAELLSFRYYRKEVMGVQRKAEKVLREMRLANPLGIPYIVSADKSSPGKFVLSYLPRDQCLHNYIIVTPRGLRFGGYCFARLNDLINWFKQYSKDPIPGQTTVITPRMYSTTLNMQVTQINPLQAIQNFACTTPRPMYHSHYSQSQPTTRSPFYTQIKKRVL